MSIVSRLPVSSPTAIICATIAGKIGASLSGAAIEPPDLTDSMTASIASLDHGVAGGLAGHLDRLHDRHAGGVERGERARPARERDLLDRLADLERDPQAEAVPLRAAPVGLAATSEADDEADRAGDQDVPLAGDHVGQADRELA